MSRSWRSGNSSNQNYYNPNTPPSRYAQHGYDDGWGGRGRNHEYEYNYSSRSRPHRWHDDNGYYGYQHNRHYENYQHLQYGNQNLGNDRYWNHQDEWNNHYRYSGEQSDPAMPYSEHYEPRSCSNLRHRRNWGTGNKNKSKNSIPDRWEDYTKIGSKIGKTSLIAMKVPLKSCLNDKIEPEEEQFSCSTAIQLVEDKFRKELGMVINLCNTTRYYDKQEFTQKGVEHKHITVPGHVVPGDEYFVEFTTGIQKFESDENNKHKLIAVHCTHGLNRTGYLVCRYLIEEKGMSPNEAIQLFNDTRGHKMERQNYIDDLLSRKPKGDLMKQS